MSAVDQERALFEQAYAAEYRKIRVVDDFTADTLVSMRTGETYGDRAYLNGQWKGWQLRAQQPYPNNAANAFSYVEVRQCDECLHSGLNDAATGEAACHDCDWTGPDPAADKCPGCQSENCMAAACPKCGARYVLLVSEHIEANRDHQGEQP